MENSEFTQYLEYIRSAYFDHKTGIRFKMNNKPYFGIIWSCFDTCRRDNWATQCLKVYFKYIFQEHHFSPLLISRKPQWIRCQKTYTIPIKMITHIFILNQVFYSPLEPIPASDSFADLMRVDLYTTETMRSLYRRASWQLI